METATSIELFVEILDRYVYYFDQQNEAVCFPPSLPTSLSGIVLIPLFSPGDNEIPEWSYRIDPLKFGRQSARIGFN
jgi:hypothetical protein